MRTLALIIAGLTLSTGCRNKAEDTADTGAVTDDAGTVDDTGPAGTVDDTDTLPTDETGLTGSDSDTAVTGIDTDSGDTGGDTDTGPTGPEDADGDGFTADEDCDDTDADVYPGAAEIPYDGIDNDCDEATLDDDLDEDGFVEAEDCDDLNPAVNPDASEICDGVDNDCSGDADTDAVDAATWYADRDEDGYGATVDTLVACEQPEGYVTYFDDCDDTDAAYNPGATEDDCTDPNDYNCDGSVGYSDDDGDGFAACEECDDGDAAINPGADEICDLVDNNCDGFIDEDTAVDASDWYRDIDRDGWGDADDFVTACDEPLGYAAADEGIFDCDDNDASLNQDDADADGVTTCAGDCDDGNSTISPEAEEACDDVDNDCDALTDEGFDVDGDGWRTCDGDCDDDPVTGGGVNPAADETCDGVDNNCDGDIDEDALDVTTWYFDYDGDGFGDADFTDEACAEPAGYTSDSADCDDADAAINPDAVEVCDGLDNNCDGLADGDDATDQATWYVDADADGYGDSSVSQEACDAPDGFVAAAGPGLEDCDDDPATGSGVNPGATEVCDDIDNDCDVDIDEGTLGTYYADFDADGFGDAGAALDACEAPANYVPDDTDCDDGNGATNPDADEVCDSQDNDCDSAVDEDAADDATWYADADSDGYGDAADAIDSCAQPLGYVASDTDCDDDPATGGGVNPAADEVCDGLDNDCDTRIDEGTLAVWYADSDADGFGDAASSAEACEAPDGYTDNSDDCDDDAATGGGVNPDADEVCDAVDNNCDGDVDEDSAVDAPTWYFDYDSDGYGNPTLTAVACEEPANYTDRDDDCDDTDGATNPDASEICDEADNDCDELVDEGAESSWYLDYDGDGYGDDTREVIACDAPTSDYVPDGGDCDDADEDFNPGEPEYCDDQDHDCDGAVDSDADGDDYSDIECGGSDCDDSDPLVLPEVGGGCALGATCLDILDLGRSVGDGPYVIDPDGYGAGLDPFEVTCDMSTDGGGWTAIEYADDLDFIQHFTTGDGYRYFATDFELVLDDAQVSAIQAESTEGRQLYVGYCEHVIHYYYNDGASYAYSFGFRFFDGTETPFGTSSYSPYDVSVIQDACAGNGGEGGDPDLSTIFEFNSPLVPIINVNTSDVGDAFPEYFGSPLLDNPAWLR